MTRTIKLNSSSRDIHIPEDIPLNEKSEITLIIMTPTENEFISEEDGWKAAERLCNSGYSSETTDGSETYERYLYGKK